MSLSDSAVLDLTLAIRAHTAAIGKLEEAVLLLASKTPPPPPSSKRKGTVKP